MASLTYRNRRRKAQLRRLARMRAAKERKRLERGPIEPEPRMVRWNRFQITVTDRLTGESWTGELRSVRDIARRLAMLMRYYT